MPNRTAVYPGTFDPITHGHMDVIARGAKLFDRLVVAVAVNIGKSPIFSVDERLEMIREAVEERGLTGVEVVRFDGMIVDFVRSVGSSVLLRGIRTLSDWESEFQMALTNRDLAPDIETVFVMASLEYSYVSSRLIREVATLGGEVEKFLPPGAARRIRERTLERNGEGRMRAGS